MPRSAARRSVGATLTVALALLAGLLSSASPAAAAVTPVIDGISPMSGPTAGGTPVRIYGSDFIGTTAVRFGSALSPKFKVVDKNLITAITPVAPVANNTTVDVSVTANGLTGTMTEAFTYTNATLTVTPRTGLANGSAVTVQLTGYKPNVEVIPVEFNPLQLYVEQFPDFPFGPPPYVDVIGPFPFPKTDASGNLTFPANVTSGATFVAGTNNGANYDANVACPVNQTTMNFLGTSTMPAGQKQPFNGRCNIAISQAGIGALETPITFAAERTPGAPIVFLNTSTATKGQQVTVAPGSRFWTANPFFGSTKGAVSPGETRTEVKLCGLGGNAAACSTGTNGNVTVKMTRYIGKPNPAPPPTINGTFTGGTLGGQITIGASEPPCSTCFVRVRQFRPDGTFIEATRALTIT